MKTFVISLGGSLVVPDSIDVDFLIKFKKSVEKFLSESDSRIIFVVGGGKTARKYQNALKSIQTDISSDSLDWLGIKATHLNAELVKEVFSSQNKVVINPDDKDINFDGRILVAAGWKPGFSTDMDTVFLAKKFGASLCINLSNIDKVYTKNPKEFSDAKPIDKITWKDFIDKIVGTEWLPGNNYPFDPVASDFAMKNNITVVCANGSNIENTINILKGSDFIGTIISNE